VLIRIITSTYPNFRPINVSDTVDAWCEMLSDYTYEQAAAALKVFTRSDTSGFAPTIGQLIDKINTINSPQELNESQAWCLVRRAISNSFYHAEEEFAKLPPIIQRAVGHPSNLRDKAIDEEYNDGVEKSNFIKAYRIELERQRERNSMSPDMRHLLENPDFYRPPKMIAEKEPDYSECIPMPPAVKERLERMKGAI
jgi:hypothetical protein